ncbi:hypothetical protein DYB35_012803 [Aphanomyces astaci]|uniref:DDE-1 domain-containing protein n=1 Tax=Aphanomyces astaci TaxID=112090 RepID=A0A418DX80_APHAT|nr:hypothetical protein DYB35_012803 [Aphanomyces astaci]
MFSQNLILTHCINLGEMKLRMSLEDKHELYQEHLRRPHTHYSELANWAKITFNLSTTPAKSTICNAIKRNHTKSQRVDAKARTMDRNVALAQVEAKIRIKFAKGWLYKFQRKHGFRSMIQHGEAASVPPEQVQEGRKKVLHETSGYNSSDIYNMDETAFFFCLSPHRSITRNRLPGTKKSKKRITVALTTNADGSDLVDPLFVGSAKQPRCFGGLSGRDLGFEYQASKKAWMNGQIFSTYLSDLNERMATANRKVLLLVDNAPSYKADDDLHLSNVELKMLPKNTTAHLHPQDAGIIASFKAKVKQLQLQHALEQINSVMTGRQDKFYEVSMLEAMEWARDAWRSVAQTTVANCWARTRILDCDLAAFGQRMGDLHIE